MVWHKLTSLVSNDLAHISVFLNSAFYRVLSFTQADLIHLGAKYSPCMRRDQGIEKGYKKDLEEERNSACCIRDDGSGCAQMSESRCSVSYKSGIL